MFFLLTVAIYYFIFAVCKLQVIMCKNQDKLDKCGEECSHNLSQRSHALLQCEICVPVKSNHYIHCLGHRLHTHCAPSVNSAFCPLWTVK